jgi:hypothetical protein
LQFVKLLNATIQLLSNNPLCADKKLNREHFLRVDFLLFCTNYILLIS